MHNPASFHISLPFPFGVWLTKKQQQQQTLILLASLCPGFTGLPHLPLQRRPMGFQHGLGG